LRLLIITAVIILATETLIMFLLRLFHFSHPLIAELLDGLILTALTAPALYFFLVRPLELAISNLRRAEAVLHHAHDDLEQQVIKRTAALSESNVALKQQIAERKQAEEANRRLAGIVAYSNDAIVSKNLDGTITSWNHAAEQTYGYAATEIIGKPVTLLIPPERWDEEPGILQRICRGEPVEHYETVRRRKDGTLVDVSLTVSPIKDARDNIIGASKIARDITERKCAEEALRTSRDNLAEVFNNVHVAIFVHDTQGPILAVNDKMLDLYQVDREQAPRLSIKDDYSAPSNPLASLPAIWQKVLAGETHSMEWAARRPRDGSTFPAEVFLRKVTWGGRDAVMATVHDLSEKKALEKQFLRAQRLESIGTLASGIAHDLNNILAAIMMSAQILQLQRPGKEECKMLATILASAKRGAEVVKQVLTFARGVEGERVILQAKHLIKEIHKIAEETFPKQITFRSDVPKDLWTLTGDATQLHQVLMNLCVNARDAMPEGGTLLLSAENVQVAKAKASLFADGKAGPHVLIQVSDTGSGIPPAIIEKIFEPFFTTKELGKGTGLGLSTLLGIVRSHGGFVDVESEPGRGSTFKVYLPAHPGKAVSRVDATPPPSPRGAGECILVVDDEVNVRSMTERTLTQHGYQVLLAANGKEALGLVASHPAGVKAVVTDIMMPVMDGVALVQVLKQTHPRMLVIACTGWGQEGIQAKLKGLGVESFLEKPYPLGALLMVLRDHLTPAG
jgi:PAS domain S-box-containing protein